LRDDLGVDGNVMLKWSLKKYGGRFLTGIMSFEMGISGELL